MRIEQANERLTGSLKTVARDADESRTGTAGQAVEPRNRLAAAVDATNGTCQRVEDETVAALQATDRCIRAHPYEAIGVAFGLGLCIGLLLGRK